MAGGIDWFRWHHGSVNDPKFQLVAKRSKSSVAEVIAVWASLLEAASMAEKRGAAGSIDHEAMDCALGLEDGQSARIVDAMRARSLVDGEDCQVMSWEKRQPKREREDDTAAERKRRQRAAEAEAAAASAAGLDTGGVTDGVTPCHATSRQKTPRGEERREEEIPSTGVDGTRAPTPGEACKAMRSQGMADTNPSSPTLVALLDAGITLGELTAAAKDAVDKKKPFAYALKTAEGRRRDAAIAPLPAARGAAEPAWRAEQRERTQQAAPGVAAGTQHADEFFIEAEARHVIAHSVD